MSGRCTKLHSEHFAMKEKILNENIVAKDLKLNYNFLPLCTVSLRCTLSPAILRSYSSLSNYDGST